ncbi:unnamed protein product [Paramecium pentaurelia]|uniref:Uncharacterized protein n=1 Tax=Paramecium pentaurelia TaxID=43138 RepID=A0A8S1TK62_9CILI|nr:unnamed protein product [Paramecium pentaurelia]
MLIFLILLFQTFSVFTNSVSICKYQYSSQLLNKFQLRGYYQDVAAEFNGTFVKNARNIRFVGSSLNISPFRYQLYYVWNRQGHVGTLASTSTSIDIQFSQAYEINQIIVWFYDIDGRNHCFKIIAFDQYNQETELFQGLNLIGIVKISFQDQIVQTLKIVLLPGGTYNDLNIIKISAFYANRSMI